jgi:predicted nucleic acid-binding protein
MILVDSNVLIALVDESDSLNKRALADLALLGRPPKFVAGPVLVETLYYFDDAHHRGRLLTWLLGLSVQVASTDSLQTWGEAFAWCEKYADHHPDWADACLAVLSGSEHRFKVWTYDSEFRTTWRRPDGTRIPLAVR